MIVCAGFSCIRPAPVRSNPRLTGSTVNRFFWGHPYTEVVTMLCGNDMEKRSNAKAGILFRASRKSHSSYLDNGRGNDHTSYLLGQRALPVLIRTEDPRIHAQQKDAPQPAATPSPAPNALTKTETMKPS